MIFHFISKVTASDTLDVDPKNIPKINSVSRDKNNFHQLYNLQIIVISHFYSHAHHSWYVPPELIRFFYYCWDWLILQWVRLSAVGSLMYASV